MAKSSEIEEAYRLAKDQYANWGVNTEDALGSLSRIAISLHCWQGDDVGGFESPEAELTGGIAATGSYPGKARNANELRMDIEKAMDLTPSLLRLNLHAIYGDYEGPRVDRNELEPRHFASWIDWARSRKMGVDFNGTFFSHPRAADGFTLSHRDEGVRRFWIEHGIACRKIGQAFGKSLGSPCVTNVWIPDGYKDNPIDRKAPRERLIASLDEIFRHPIDPQHNLDAVESKLFGLGSESYVAGSHEFYMGYAIARRKLLCLDSGHFHPTETISDKISSILCFLDRVLLHVSRGVRWDSDHVVILSDELQAIAQAIVRGNYLDRVHIGLDYFDAGINRIAAWVIGVRAMSKALLGALLEPFARLCEFERNGDYTARLAATEELKTLPFSAVWDYYCLTQNVPVGMDWLEDVKKYERDVLSERR